MHLDVDKDVCLINITLSFFYQLLERKLPNANIVDILFSVLVSFFGSRYTRCQFVVPLEAKTFQ